MPFNLHFTNSKAKLPQTDLKAANASILIFMNNRWSVFCFPANAATIKRASGALKSFHLLKCFLGPTD